MNFHSFSNFPEPVESSYNLYCRILWLPTCWGIPHAIEKWAWLSSWERGKGENWGRAPYGASPGGRRAASQSHSVGRPVLSPLARSGQGGQASGQLESGRPAVAKTLWQESQELRSRGHPWIWNCARSVSVQDWTDCLNPNELGCRLWTKKLIMWDGGGVAQGISSDVAANMSSFKLCHPTAKLHQLEKSNSSFLLKKKNNSNGNSYGW